MRRAHAQLGFTLMEVLIAITIMAMIAALTAQVLQTAIVSGETTDDAAKRTSSVDRTWVMLDTDLRNALPRALLAANNDPLPALYVGRSGDYWLTLLRGGMANPLKISRSELARVGYRLEEGVLWRDIWQDTGTIDRRKAIALKLMTDIKSIQVRVLSDVATSIAAGPWLEDWPNPNDRSKLPRALEITLQTEDFGEIKRLIGILPGEDVTCTTFCQPQVPNNPNNPNNPSNPNNPNQPNNTNGKPNGAQNGPSPAPAGGQFDN